MYIFTADSNLFQETLTGKGKKNMTKEFKDQNALEIDGRLICRHFLRGKCIKAGFYILWLEIVTILMGTWQIEPKPSIFKWVRYVNVIFYSIYCQWPDPDNLFCLQGDDCQLEHALDVNYSINEVCKFYVQGSCSKGESCIYMHNILFSAYCKCPLCGGWGGNDCTVFILFPCVSVLLPLVIFCEKRLKIT